MWIAIWGTEWRGLHIVTWCSGKIPCFWFPFIQDFVTRKIPQINQTTMTGYQALFHVRGFIFSFWHSYLIIWIFRRISQWQTVLSSYLQNEIMIESSCLGKESLKLGTDLCDSISSRTNWTFPIASRSQRCIQESPKLLNPPIMQLPQRNFYVMFFWKSMVFKYNCFIIFTDLLPCIRIRRDSGLCCFPSLVVQLNILQWNQSIIHRRYTV